MKMFAFNMRRGAMALMMVAGLSMGSAGFAAEPAAAAPPKPYVIQGTVPKYVRDAVELKERTPAMTAPAARPACGRRQARRPGG